MASIAIKDVQAHTEGMAIEFDVNLGIYLDDADLEIEQFKVSVNIRLFEDALRHIGRRWEIQLNDGELGIRFWLSYKPGQEHPKWAYDYFRLPHDLHEHVGVEQARCIRALASLENLIDKRVNVSQEEFIKSADGRERDIHIKIPLVIDYEAREGSPHLRDYLDTISLDNCRWNVEAVFESDATCPTCHQRIMPYSATAKTVFCREAQCRRDGKPIDEETGEFI